MDIWDGRFYEHAAGWDVYKAGRKIAELEFVEREDRFFIFKPVPLAGDLSEIDRFYKSSSKAPQSDSHYKNRQTGVIASDREMFGGFFDGFVRLGDYRRPLGESYWEQLKRMWRPPKTENKIPPRPSVRAKRYFRYIRGWDDAIPPLPGNLWHFRKWLLSDNAGGWEVFKAGRKIAELDYNGNSYPHYSFIIKPLIEDRTEIERFFDSAWRDPEPDAYYKNRRTGVVVSDEDMFGGIAGEFVSLVDCSPPPKLKWSELPKRLWMRLTRRRRAGG